MTREEAINYAIGEGVKDKTIDTNLISDGYHTFGELYTHRIELYIKVAEYAYNDFEPVWASKKHPDGIVWDGWFLLGIYKRKGKQITYHLPIEYWDRVMKFADELEIAPGFDGHTSNDVLERIRKL